MSDENDKWYIKSRYLIFVFILSFILAIILKIYISPDSVSDELNPLAELVFEYLFYFCLFFFIYSLSRKAELKWYALFGKFKLEYISSSYLLIVLPMLVLSFAAVYVVYLPLSFIAPEFVNEWLVDVQVDLIWFEGNNYKVANLLSFFSTAIFTPVLEEIFFRGLLFTSLANKWGIKKAIVISSIFFGVFHLDILGGFVFGIVTCILYLKTKSLFAPIILHFSNNAIAYILLYFSYKYDNDEYYTLTDFQNEWWLGIIALVSGISWLIYFYRKEILGKLFRIPYFFNLKSL